MPHVNRTRPKVRRLLLPVVALAVALALAAGLWQYHRARVRAQDSANALYRAASSLSACITRAASAPDLVPPDAAPLVDCVPLAAELSALVAAHREIAFQRAAAPLDDLAHSLALVRGFPLSASAEELSKHSGLKELLDQSANVLAHACAAARAEAVFEQGACPPLDEATPAPFAQRVLIDAPLPAAIEHFAWDLAVHDGDSATLAIVSRAGTSVTLHALSTRDGGKSFDESHASWSGTETPRPVLVSSAGVAVVEAKRLRYFSLLRDGKALTERPLPALPAQYSPLSRGVPVLALENELVVPLDGDPARVWFVPEQGEPRERAAPVGQLVAALPTEPPVLVLQRQGGTGFVQLVQVPVTSFDAPWQESVVSTVPYVSELTLEPAAAPECGLPGERFFVLLGRGSSEVLAALGAKRSFVFRFSASQGAELDPVCGHCPPMALEHSPKAARVFVPVRRKLAPASLKVPIAYRQGDAWRSASAACRPGSVLVAYLSEGRVLAQSTENTSWSFSRPAVLAEPSEQGTPVRALTLGFEKRTLVLWQRRPQDGRRLLVELSSLP